MNLETITLRFFISGHNQSECDNVHSVIERKMKNVDIYHPDHYNLLIRSCNFDVVKIGSPECQVYDVRGSSNKVLLNRNLYLDEKEGKRIIKTVSWMRNKVTVIGKFTLGMSDSYSEDDCVIINVREKPRIRAKRVSRQPSEKLMPPMIKQPGKESMKTITNLQKLCKNNQIPKEYQDYFMKLDFHSDSSDQESDTD